MSANHEITHVSDTALMVAACRADEDSREDAWVRDPFAARLAGERGHAILNALPHAGVLRFGLAVRTRFIDELLLESLASAPVHTVINLGCGLDTRPWRLDLPKSLRWIEVDFPDVLDYKDGLMAGASPRCLRERMTADLNDGSDRRKVCQAVGGEFALMITEGLLLYLPAATVEGIAYDFKNDSPVHHWISDITTSSFTQAMGGADAMKSIRHVQAPDALKGEEILDVLHRHGWNPAAKRSYITDVEFTRPRILKMMGGNLPPRPQFPPGDPTGLIRFERP
jgi:methyltransferase (TIGR00027 family)